MKELGWVERHLLNRIVTFHWMFQILLEKNLLTSRLSLKFGLIKFTISVKVSQEVRIHTWDETGRSHLETSSF